MIELKRTDMHIPTVRAWEVDLLPGQAMALVDAVLDERADAVYVQSVGPAEFRRLERSGIPYRPAEAMQRWTRAGESDNEVALQPAWVSDQADWQSPGALAIMEMIGASFETRRRDESGDQYWHVDGSALVRRTSDARELQVTATTIRPELVTRLATALPSLIGSQDGVRIPIQQVPTLQALSRTGFHPAEPMSPMVLLPLLSRSVDPPLTRSFEVSHADIDAFGRTSGDLNPMHFDDAFARKRGFQGRIAHGMIFNGWLTRLLGTEYPGVGTIFLGQQTAFLQPVYPGIGYEVTISSPVANVERGTYRVLAQVRDSEGRVTALSYCDLLRRVA